MHYVPSGPEHERSAHALTELDDVTVVGLAAPALTPAYLASSTTAAVAG